MATAAATSMFEAMRLACRPRALCTLAVPIMLAACTFTVPRPTVAPPAAALAPEALKTPEQSLALTVDAYKRDVARHIYGTSAEHLFEGPPPPQLRAVVVLSLRIDPTGNLTRVSVLRSNGYRELEEIALQSVRRAAPLPMPNRLVMHNGSADFVETWLFREDGRFQIRSLASEQASVDD